MIIGFNVRANRQAKENADKENIEVRYYSIIYNVADDVKNLLLGRLKPQYKENFLGYAEILEVFYISKTGRVAGCKVTEGIIKKGCKVRLLRDDVVIHEGDLSQLKRFKDDVKEVRDGNECGAASCPLMILSFDGFGGITGFPHSSAYKTVTKNNTQ